MSITAEILAFQCWDKDNDCRLCDMEFKANEYLARDHFIILAALGNCIHLACKNMNLYSSSFSRWFVGMSIKGMDMMQHVRLGDVLHAVLWNISFDRNHHFFKGNTRKWYNFAYRIMNKQSQWRFAQSAAVWLLKFSFVNAMSLVHDFFSIITKSHNAFIFLKNSINNITRQGAKFLYGM